MSSSSFENVIYKIGSQIIYLIYMYKEDLAVNNLQRLNCYKTQVNKQVDKNKTI